VKPLSRIAPLALLTSLVLCSQIPAEPTVDERRWIEQVLFGGDSQRDERICHRWARTPRVAVIHSSPDQRRAAEEAVKHVNEVLAGTPVFKLELVGKEPREPDIRIHFGAEKELPALAEKLGFKFAHGNRGYHWAWWNDRGEMTRAEVLIADELKGTDLRSMVLKELVQSLGLAFESPAYPDSIFYRDGKRETRATQLSPLDRRLIALFYSRIKPGSKLAEARVEFKLW
jgi:hypothetical protein